MFWGKCGMALASASPGLLALTNAQGLKPDRRRSHDDSTDKETYSPFPFIVESTIGNTRARMICLRHGMLRIPCQAEHVPWDV